MYSTKELAQTINISYDRLRHARDTYEEYLKLFYDYSIIRKGNTISYLFKEQYEDFIPYIEYSNAKRSKLLQKKIKETIKQDSRQTGSNIARIIIVDGEIEALNLQLSTLTNYTRVQLRKLVESGYYFRTDYQWCYLDKDKNQYILMTETQIKELRSFFDESRDIEKEEQYMADFKEHLLTTDQITEILGKLKIKSFNAGIKKYQEKYNAWPIKVPVYERCAWVEK